jgi:tRNA pseudouridine55 synthase
VVYNLWFVVYLHPNFLLENQFKNIYEQGQVLFINKPLQWTSFDVVRKIQWLTKAKTGHAGTLDPLATGLLIICTGKFTKRIHEFMAQEKEYTGVLVLGAATPTFDLESEPENFKDISSMNDSVIHEAVKKFTGEILQVPPIHSAIKKDGKRVYELARKGIAVKLEPRKIVVKKFEITAVTLPEIHFRVVCSTGTYIRSLANDLGAELGCGAYLSSLCRTRIGEYRLDKSMTMEEAGKIITQQLHS